MIDHFQGRKRIEHTVRSWKWAIVSWWPDIERAKRFWAKYFCNVRVNWRKLHGFEILRCGILAVSAARGGAELWTWQPERLRSINTKVKKSIKIDRSRILIGPLALTFSFPFFSQLVDNRSLVVILDLWLLFQCGTPDTFSAFLDNFRVSDTCGSFLWLLGGFLLAPAYPLINGLLVESPATTDFYSRDYTFCGVIDDSDLMEL